MHACIRSITRYSYSPSDGEPSPSNSVQSRGPSAGRRLTHATARRKNRDFARALHRIPIRRASMPSASAAGEPCGVASKFTHAEARELAQCSRDGGQHRRTPVSRQTPHSGPADVAARGRCLAGPRHPRRRDHSLEVPRRRRTPRLPIRSAHNHAVKALEARPIRYVVGARGFEPPTPWSQTRCATRLRYAPKLYRLPLPDRCCKGNRASSSLATSFTWLAFHPASPRAAPRPAQRSGSCHPPTRSSCAASGSPVANRPTWSCPRLP